MGLFGEEKRNDERSTWEDGLCLITAIDREPERQYYMMEMIRDYWVAAGTANLIIKQMIREAKQ